MNIDYKKIGSFIAKLRKEKKMTQEDLAEKLFVERETISKWERGVNNLNTDTLLKLCDIFNITLNEIILGEKQTKENINKINNVTGDILKKNHKIKKFLIGNICIIITLLVVFLSYYFINNYNSIKVYDINGENEYFSIYDGIIVVSREKVFINIGNIEKLTDMEVLSAKLYYKKNNKDIILYEEDHLGFISYTSNYKDSKLKYNDLKYLMSNMYVEFKLEDNTSSILKLELSKLYSNNQMLQSYKEKLSQEDINNLNSTIPTYVKANFKFDEKNKVYYFEESIENKIIRQEYYYEAKVYIVYEKNSDCEESYVYSKPDITYSQSCEDRKNNLEFVYAMNDKTCIAGECNNDKIEYFTNKYLDKVKLDQ